MKPSRVFCALVIFGFGLFAVGQKFADPPVPPTAVQIQAWLRSGDPQSVAWGAHYVLVTKNQALVSELLSLADTWQPFSPPKPDVAKRSSLTDNDVDRRDAMSAVLDALIQMDVSVPVETLRNLAPDFPNHVAVLLSRLPLEESETLSFDLYRSGVREGYGLQYVSAALLAQNPPAGFAAHLFSNIHNRATIFVIAPGAGEIGGGTAGDCFQSTASSPRPRWPVFGTYTLSKENSRGSFLVVSGIDPIFALRSETTHYVGQACGSRVYLGAEERRRLLAQMLKISPEAIDWQTELRRSIQFSSEQQFASDLRRFIAAQEEKYRVTAATLVAKGLLTTAEQDDSLPWLDIHLSDARGPGYAAIPPPSPWPARVSIDNPWH